MGLPAGIKLGPYEILSSLGAGGMGEVYRARDTKLNRDVALKVLPEAFASDSQRMARFEREAQVLASLNHPNIASIYGLEESASTRALVMELVEGQTLANVVGARHGVPLHDALPVAQQIAEALEYAHERGIIHRDLKPANIKITPEGSVKVLDFGLAKALGMPGASGVGTIHESPLQNTPTMSPTLSIAATQAGMILGTAAYMSPEQARGKTVDQRTDIWAFGCLLYEMLTGRKPFEGETVTDVLASVVKSEPDWNELSGDTPPRVRELIRRCLHKDPKQRLRDIGEARIAIEGAITGVGAIHESPPRGTGATPPVMRVSPLQRLLPWALAGLLFVALIAAVALWKFPAPIPQPSFQQLTFDRGLIYAARFAPDGRTILYSAAWNDRPQQIYSTTPDSPEWRPLGLKGSMLYAVSPSQMAVSKGCRGIFIGVCEGTLAVTPISLDAPRELAQGVISADWGPDGKELAVARQVNGKYQIEFPLGKVIYQSPTWLNFLRVSPDGRALGFAEFAGPWADSGQIIILGRDGKQIAQSQPFVSIEGLAWSPRGNEVWFGAGRAFAWANAIHAFSLLGKERLLLRLPGMVRLHDVARDGRILFSQEIWRDETAFRAADSSKERDLSWLDSSDVTDISPDGKEIAFFGWGESSAESNVLVRRTDGSPPVKLGRGEFSLLSPDGQWVLTALPGNSPHLVLLPSAAGEPRELETTGIHQFATPGWMPDGKQVYFAGNDGQDWRMYVQSLAGGPPHAFTPAIMVLPEANEAHLVSPDGKWAFSRDANGKPWIYSLEGGAARPVSGLADSDAWINWSTDGRSGYVCQDNITRALVFRLDLASGKRQLLTELAPSDPAGLTAVTPVRVTPDGKFFVYSFDRDLSSLFLAKDIK